MKVTKWIDQGPRQAHQAPVIRLCFMAFVMIASLVGVTAGEVALDRHAPAGAETICTTNPYRNPTEAQDNFVNDCGTPFLQTPAYRCDWTVPGWVCSGPGTATEPDSTSSPDAPPEPDPDPGDSKRSVIISMGDSYLSGQSGHLIGNHAAERRSFAYEPSTNIFGRNLCRRSDVAPILSAEIPGVEAINIACSGAMTDNITTTSRFGEAPQIQQLQQLAATNDVEMVVISIGGNDAGFAEFAAACVAAFVGNTNCSGPGGFSAVFEAACATYVGNTNCSGPGGLSAAFEARVANDLRPGVMAAVRRVKEVLWVAGHRDARIVLQSYPSAVPAATPYNDGQRLSHGCAFTDADLRYVNTSFVQLLDRTLHQIASESDIEFLSLADAFDGKELCSPGVTSRNNTANRAHLEWITGIRIAGGTATQESLHPNALGQQAMGRCLQLLWDSGNRYHKCYNDNGLPEHMTLVGPGQERPRNDGSLGVTPICRVAISDPDGDGWGFEGGAACVAPVAPEDVDCDTEAFASEARLCELIIDRINRDLDLARISIDKDGLLLTLNDPTRRQINESSCSAKAWITHVNATVRIGRGADLDLAGNSITEPFAIGVRLPFDLAARVRGKTEFGHRLLFGSCNDAFSDSYHGTASARGTADLAAAFDFDPTFGVNDAGNLVVTIEPKAYVAAALSDFDLNFRVSGANPIAQFYAFLSGLTRGLSDFFVAGLSGDSARDAFANQLPNIGVPLALTAGSNGFARELIADHGETLVEREAEHITADLEADLNRQLAEALDLDADGRRTFVIDGRFARLLSGDSTLEDLLVADRR